MASKICLTDKNAPASDEAGVFSSTSLSSEGTGKARIGLIDSRIQG
jgi:hypothetical protein